MKFLRGLIVVGLLLCGLKGSAQVEEQYNPYARGKNDTIAVQLTRLEDGTMIPFLPVQEVEIKGARPRTPEEQALYNRLKYNVTKVFPYAVFAKKRYARLETELAVTGDKKVQKKLVKACDDEIKAMFSKEIKNMTITQGDILIKLIDRETGKSSYEMVRELKSGVVAWGYQLVGGLYGHNLKEKYDPEKDYAIESIVQTLEYRYN